MVYSLGYGEDKMAKDKRFSTERINPESGDVEQWVLQPKHQPQYYPTGRYLVMFQDGLAHIASLDLTGEQMRVWAYMVSKLDFDNYILLRQVDIAKHTGIRQPHVARAVKALVEHKVIIQGPKSGTANTYRLAPDFGWKGQAKNGKKKCAAN